MTYACPSGHDSTDPDTCSQCRLPMTDSAGLPRNPTYPIAPPVRCPSCGRERPSGAARCPDCGGRYPLEPDPLPPPTEVTEFEAVISADRGFYERTGAGRGEDRPPFPGYAPERTVWLRDGAVEIGRVHHRARAERPLPGVNLAERPAADLGVSHLHAVLQREGDDWTVTDLESKNGTHVDGVTIEPQAPQPLRPDSVVNIGFWTAILLRPRDTGERP